MSKLNTLTIVVVTYRRSIHLIRCIESILKQKHLPKQIYIIDNDYQKSAKHVYNKYKQTKNLKYFCEPQKGISKARNLALKTCRTKYIAFIDDDCQLSSNWSQIVFDLIKKTNLTFFQGNIQTKSTNNKLVTVQQKTYQEWINKPYSLDTKNLIINLKVIKKNNICFDPDLPIFEDVDFGLQIKKHHLKGKFIKDLTVKHQEISNLKVLIKKYYFRGKIKYVLNKKWNNFDNFKPNFISNLKNILKKPKDILSVIFNQCFNFGFLVAKLRSYTPNYNTITIVNNIDKSANGERCSKITNFLKTNGYQVELVNSQKIFEKEIKNKFNCLYQPIIYPLYRLLRHLYYQSHKKITPSSYIFYLELIVRGKIIKRYLQKKQTKLAIIQYPEDITVGLESNNFKIIFDLPTIYSEETKNHQIFKLENKIFKKNIPICFHWYSILNYAKKINLKPKNNFILNWGCNSQIKISQYSSYPKIVHIGNLNSPWVNQKLLKRIQTKTPIDIYSYEKPNILYNIKMLGFLKNLSKLSQYQFGLITISKDQFRKNSFSAKHLTYFSYGLPVFCPEWRKDPLLAPATIYYNEDNFEKQFKKYSQKNLWVKKHQAAIKIAKKLDWKKTLIPLLNVIYKIENENHN